MKYIFVFLLVFIGFLGNTQESERKLIESGIEAMQNKDYEQSLSLLVKAKSIAKQNNHYNELYLAINNIGANYYSMFDYGEALSNYLEAYNIAIEYLESKNEMIVLNNIAILYSKERNLVEAETYFKKAYEIADKNNDNLKKGLYAINLGGLLNEKNDLKEAKEYLEEAIPLVAEKPAILLSANLNMFNNLMLRGETKTAISMSHKLVNKLEDIGSPEQIFSNYMVLSKAYQKQGDSRRAYFYANKSLEDKNIYIDDKIKGYSHLSNILISQNNFKKAIEAKDSIIKAEKELNAIKNGGLFESNKVKFEVKNYQRELQYNQEKIESQRIQFYILLVGSVLVVCAIGWSLRNSYIKNKQKKILHEKAEELIRLELEKEKTENLLLEEQLKEKEAVGLLQQEKLKNEIEAKNRKLSAKALYLSNRNNLVSNIIKDLEKVNSVKKDTQLNNQLKNLKDLLKAENEWESFIKHFEEVNQGILENLKQKHPSLNTNDLRFLSYIYMNLSLKEIALIFNITPQTCRKRKERVSKKLGLETSSQLYDYLYSID